MPSTDNLVILHIDNSNNTAGSSLLESETFGNLALDVAQVNTTTNAEETLVSPSCVPNTVVVRTPTKNGSLITPEMSTHKGHEYYSPTVCDQPIINSVGISVPSDKLDAVTSDKVAGVGGICTSGSSIKE